MSLSSSNLMESTNPFERLDQESSSKAKLGRYACKSETHAKHNIASDKQFFLDSWWHHQQEHSHLLNPDRIRNASASLPCSPNHQMPPKWRFKHRKQDDNASASRSEPLTPEIKHGMISAEKRHPDLINYDDKFVVTQTHDNTLEAYQNNEELIVISNEMLPEGENELMDTTEESKSTPSLNSKRATMKLFRTPSEEIREINEGRMMSDDSSAFKNSMIKSSFQPPIIRVVTPSQHELKEKSSTLNTGRWLANMLEINFLNFKTYKVSQLLHAIAGSSCLIAAVAFNKRNFFNQNFVGVVNVFDKLYAELNGQ